MEFENESVYYYRFVTHLKFLAQRLVTKTTYDEEESELFTMVRDKYDQSYQCGERIAKFIQGRISLWSFRGRKVILDDSR
ncbi:MAG: PRD domain-containing protein [Mediterraneibacter gnavus]